MRSRAAGEPVQPPARPMVVAHRGASHDIAEHTLAAYVRAIESGADALECDVRLTRDGHLVCVHDRTVDRTSDATGLVSDFDLDALRAMDFVSWHAAVSSGGNRPGADPADGHADDASDYLAGVEPDRVTREGGVLTLRRLLELVHDASLPVRLLIETKHPTRYGGLVEKELVDLLAAFGWGGRPGPPASVRAAADPAHRVLVMSFAARALRRVKLLAPDVPTVLLMSRKSPIRRDGTLPTGVPIAGPSLNLLRDEPDLVTRAHAHDHPVFAWTVDEPADVRYVLGLGIDTIITNRPAEVLTLLGD